MGELSNQIFSGDWELVSLNERQRELLKGQTSVVAEQVRFDLGVHMYPKIKEEVVKEISKEKDGIAKCAILSDYEEFLNFIHSENEGVFSEDEIRVLLSWAGHKHSITSPGFVRVFKKACDWNSQRNIYEKNKKGGKFLISICKT